MCCFYAFLVIRFFFFCFEFHGTFGPWPTNLPQSHFWHYCYFSFWAFPTILPRHCWLPNLTLTVFGLLDQKTGMNQVKRNVSTYGITKGKDLSYIWAFDQGSLSGLFRLKRTYVLRLGENILALTHDTRDIWILNYWRERQFRHRLRRSNVAESHRSRDMQKTLVFILVQNDPSTVTYF